MTFSVKKRGIGTATKYRSPGGGKTTLNQYRHPEANDIVHADHRAGNAEKLAREIMQEMKVEVTIQIITTADGAETGTISIISLD